MDLCISIYKMRKTVLTVMVCMAMAAVLGGCGREQSDTSSASGDSELQRNGDYVTLGDYTSISLSKKEIEEKTEENINTVLENYGKPQQKKTGKVKKGDTVNIYYVGRVGGKEFEGGSCTKKDYPDGYDLEIGSGTFIDGFEDGLIGATPGQTLDVKVTFPDPYTNNADLAGKKAVFTVTVNYIHGETVLPKLTDQFVKKNLTDYKTAKEYRQYIRDTAVEDMAWELVYNASKVNEYPQDRVDDMYDQLNQSITYYLQQNNYTLSDYLASQNTTSEDFRSNLVSTAQTDVGKQLVYGAIAEKEKLGVSQEEYEEELKSYLDMYQCKDEEELNEHFQDYFGTKARNIIEDDLLFRKVKKYLAGNVKES